MLYWYYMKIHQLDLNAIENNQSDPVVDDSLLSNHNSSFGTDIQTATAMKKKSSLSTILLFTTAVVAGIATGFGSHKLTAKTNSDTSSDTPALSQVAGNSIKDGDIFGSNDAATFINDATGYLEKGGIDGEGTHRLLRIGGLSQTVYLTSSVTDLDKLVGMEVKVWGETFSGQKAGWLMDVGRVEVIDTEALPPTEE